MLVKTPYPKTRRFTSNDKLTLLIALWVLDKAIMAVLLWILN